MSHRSAPRRRIVSLLAVGVTVSTGASVALVDTAAHAEDTLENSTSAAPTLS